MEELIEQTISNTHFTAELRKIKEFYKCTFSYCDFQNIEFMDLIFTACEFRSCNLSNSKFKGTQLDQIIFRDCKMLGILFNECSSFSFHLECYRSLLDYSSFFERNMKKFRFEECSLQHVDFEKSNLQQAVFRDCNLLHARFEQCHLEGCDFRSSVNIHMDPEVNRLKKSRFGSEQLAGLLVKHQLLID